MRIALLVLVLVGCSKRPEMPAWYQAQVPALEQRFKELDAIDKDTRWLTAPVVDEVSLRGVDPAAVALYHVELGDSSRPEMHHLDDDEMRCILKVGAGRYGGFIRFFNAADEADAKRCVTWLLSLRYVAVASFETHELSIVSLDHPAVRKRITFGRDEAVMDAAMPTGPVTARGRDYADAKANANSLYLAQAGRASQKGYVAGVRKALAAAAR